MTEDTREPVLWDCKDSEELTCTSPEEAVEEYLDYMCDPGEKLLDTIQRVCPIEVSGSAREEVDPSFASSQAESAAETFIENWEEDYGDPNGDSLMLSEAEKKTFVEKLTQLFAETLSTATVWRCEVVETRTLSEEEVTQMMREYRPEDFKEQA